MSLIARGQGRQTYKHRHDSYRERLNWCTRGIILTCLDLPEKSRHAASIWMRQASTLKGMVMCGQGWLAAPPVLIVDPYVYPVHAVIHLLITYWQAYSYYKHTTVRGDSFVLEIERLFCDISRPDRNNKKYHSIGPHDAIKMTLIHCTKLFPGR